MCCCCVSQAAAHGCKLELPAPRPEARRTAPAPFMDAWLHQVADCVVHVPSGPTRVALTRSNSCSAARCIWRMQDAFMSYFKRGPRCMTWLQ